MTLGEMSSNNVQDRFFRPKRAISTLSADMITVARSILGFSSSWVDGISPSTPRAYMNSASSATNVTEKMLRTNVHAHLRARRATSSFVTRFSACLK